MFHARTGSDPLKIVLPGIARGLLEPHLPGGVEARWFGSIDDAKAMIADADVAWVDVQDPTANNAVFAAAGPTLRWISTMRAGLDAMPLDLFRERGIVLTNGSGINAVAVAEYAVMGVLVAAKRYDRVVRLADRHEWTHDAPGTFQVEGSRALVIGMGTIGRMIADKLAGLGVTVTGVTRSGRDKTLTPDGWRSHIGAFDWIVLAAPSTDDSRGMIGAQELAAMKPGAWIINIARGDMIDQPALIAALAAKRVGGAFLDPTDPEPLPADHPLWDAPNALITMHLSGRSQTTMFQRAGELFLRNLAAWQGGRPLENQVDLTAGY